MADWSLPFTVTYRFMRVSRADGLETAKLSGFQTGGSITRNIDTDTYDSATVNYAGKLDIGSDLIRIYADVEFIDGTTTSEALGTFLPTITSYDLHGSQASCTVNLDSRLLELSEDSFDSPQTLQAGSNAIAFARQIIENAGLTCLADDSDYTLSTTWTFGLSENSSSSGEGGSLLQAVNSLCDLAGFSSAYADPYGNICLEKYVEPARRGVLHSFVEGENARFLSEVTQERDTSEVANVIYTIYETEDATIIGEAVDDDPNSEFSTVTLGRRRVAKYSYNDETTQSAADAKALELLATNQSVINRVTIEHTYVPVTCNNAVRFEYPTAGITGDFTIRTQTINLDAGILTKSELRSFERSSS